MRNLNAVHTSGPCNGCKIHKGMNTHYIKVKSKVKAAVRSLLQKYRNSKVYVTGDMFCVFFSQNN